MMPQMKPINWLFLFLILNLMLMMINIMNYFYLNIKNMKNNKLFNNKKNLKNWKW